MVKGHQSYQIRNREHILYITLSWVGCGSWRRAVILQPEVCQFDPWPPAVCSVWTPKPKMCCHCVKADGRINKSQYWWKDGNWFIPLQDKTSKLIQDIMGETSVLRVWAMLSTSWLKETSLYKYWIQRRATGLIWSVRKKTKVRKRKEKNKMSD